MMTRVWRCMASNEANASGYIRHFEQTVAPELRAIDGYRGAYILRNNDEEGIELKVMTFWDSMDAIRQFAGENTEAAVIEPAAKALLQSFDPFVVHYEIVLDHFSSKEN
jgi:heme-degrading monooxygenase HmoA